MQRSTGSRTVARMIAETPTRRAAVGGSREDRSRALVLVAAMAALMWVVEVVDLVAGDLDSAGIRPRDAEGLIGVALSPFLHGGFGHLIGNTIPFLVLGAAIALGGLARVAAVTAIVAVVGGLGTWLTAPDGTVHIGASGLVFGFASYLIARGAYSRRALHLAGGLLVLAVYGTTLLFGLVPTPGVSWQGHLFGAVGGVVAAWALHAERR
jgi:membrane associated rhomboid family serine protease